MILDVEQVYYEDSMDKQPKCYTFNLHPTVVFHNLLPHEVAVTMEVGITIDVVMATVVHVVITLNYALNMLSIVHVDV